MHCPQCQHLSSENAKFCEECGARLITACSLCGQQVSPTAKFCPACGTALARGQKGKRGKSEKTKRRRGETAKGKSSSSESQLPNSRVQSSVGERRQLTVMFIDLVGSTALSARLDPEDYQAVVQTYQRTCAEVIARFDGSIAQYLGDGVLAYFGYPTAHEDDAQRAVRAGLEIITSIQEKVLAPLARENQGEGASEATHQLQVRIGIHTGPVVVGEIGDGMKREQLALGEAPNIAARIQGIAEPNTMAVSGATYRLVSSFFACQDLGVQSVKGIATPIEVYRVLAESLTQYRLDTVPLTGLTPLVGREEELALLQRRWEQVKDHEGQVVLLSGEPGIGKSRLVRELRPLVERDNAVRIEFRCSPYYQNSALYPVIEHLQRLLQWQKEDTIQTRVAKLRTMLAQYRFPQVDTLALLAALLSLPEPADVPPLTLSPERRKQKTEEALIAWLIEEADCAPLYCVWEDLHWADPSTLELLGMLIDQTPTARLFVLLTSRPEFTPPWGQHRHFSQLTLSRLGRRQVPLMIEKATGGKSLPTEVMQQIVAKTDGVPLFVEELTKTVMESDLLREIDGHYELSGPLPPLAIPATLQDSLMARLDRLATARGVAQLGATLGREFSYELLHTVSPMDEETLQQGLRQLVETGLISQRGVPPQATYTFKHALIQDTAYQSLLKSTRQQLHQQIAQALEVRFPETKETQPELLAHHYTEAVLIEQAMPYWQQAGQKASQRSANVEAIRHLTIGLKLLKTLPDTPGRAQRELALQILLGPALIATKGWAALDTERAYIRARELCEQIGEATPQLFPVLWGLWQMYLSRAEYRRAYELGERLFTLAQRHQDPALLLVAHYTLGFTLYYLGEFVRARDHAEHGLALYDLQKHRSLAFLYGQDLGMSNQTTAAWALWHLGYIDQALERSRDAMTLAEELSHSFSSACALVIAAIVHEFRREEQAAQEQAEAMIAFCTEQGIRFFLAFGAILEGWALAARGQRKEGVARMRQGLADLRAIGGEVWRPHFLALLAEAYAKVGQVEEGLSMLAEALTAVDRTGERFYEAELYRLKGELTLQQFEVRGSTFEVENPQSAFPNPLLEAEECFLKAINVARKQQAKSLELRATVSLARLWQQQEKRIEARQMLTEIYGWFTEGFDTKDLQEAKSLLDALA